MSDFNHIKINASMFDLYKIEIETHSQKFITNLTSEFNEENIDALLTSIGAIKGAANLVKVEVCSVLSQSIEDYLNKLNNQNRPDLEVLKQAIEFIQNTSQQEISNLENPNKDTLKEIQHIQSALSSINQTEKDDTSTVETISNTAPISFETPENIDDIMLDLFLTELSSNIEILSDCLLDIENTPQDAQLLERLMRASHSIKGAARLVGIDTVVKLAHAMEDCFVAAQNDTIVLNTTSINHFLSCIDILKSVQKLSSMEHKNWTHDNTTLLNEHINILNKISSNNFSDDKSITAIAAANKPNQIPSNNPTETNTNKKTSSHDAMIRISSQRINKLMGLTGELSINAGWIRHYSSEMLNLKKKHNEIIDEVENLRRLMDERQTSELEHNIMSSIQLKLESYRENLSTQILQIDEFDRRSCNLSSQLHAEVIASRMLPFKEGIKGYKRMVRDISQSLNKKIRLIISGEDTQVDREILEKIEAPINHMIRNAIDHGVETPEQRIAAGKPDYGTIKLEASHQNGRLHISVSDDGRGVDIEVLRQSVLEKGLVNQSMAQNLTKSELLDFLFLPSFSTKSAVTELSGRGVGLDIVHSAIQEMHGKLRSSTVLGEGMHINLELPLTLSVIRSLLVKVNQELYAFPLSNIHNLLKVKRKDINTLNGRQYVSLDDTHIGLIHSYQILDISQQQQDDDELSLVIIGDWNNLYGIVVDEFISEKELALRPLNSQLGKIKDINAAAITDQGLPVLVFDVDDLLLSIQDIISGKSLQSIQSQVETSSVQKILVVDDSLTVREVEKKLLESQGYYVDVAVDGVDAWNIVRKGQYDLVISDIDMPRMNGIELVSLIKNDAALRSTPVMVVSYKDREEDKQKGLQAGADYYLTKGSFHDDSLVEIVIDLIGEATI